MSEYTKGKWKINGTVIQSETGRAVAQVWPQTNLSSKESIAAMKANARLIAAAPDLLEACEMMLPAFTDELVIDYETRDFAIAAIAKAKKVGE